MHCSHVMWALSLSEPAARWLTLWGYWRLQTSISRKLAHKVWVWEQVIYQAGRDLHWNVKLQHTQTKSTLNSAAHLILFDGACPTAALVQTPGRQTRYLPTCRVVWKDLAGEQRIVNSLYHLLKWEADFRLWLRKPPCGHCFLWNETGNEEWGTDYRGENVWQTDNAAIIFSNLPRY